VTRAARSRPPKLLPRPLVVHRAPPATDAERLERAKVAGPAAAPGRTELRRFVERIVAGDRAALGELEPIPRLTVGEAWSALDEIFGARADHPTVDATRVLDAAERATGRVRAAGAQGARIALATAAPASVLPIHQVFARCARTAGAEVADLADAGPMRADGRAGRALRWVEGVATVTDGSALLSTHDGAAAREWLFVLPRPSLVVADGVFAEAAWEAGIDVVVLGGLDRPALAIAAARGDRCTFVPARTDRPPRAYGPVVDRLQAADRPNSSDL
jgi:Phosphatase